MWHRDRRPVDFIGITVQAPSADTFGWFARHAATFARVGEVPCGDRLPSGLPTTLLVATHVSAVLELYEVEDEPPKFPAHMNLSRLVPRWKLSQAVLEAAGKSMTTREWASHVIAAKGWNADGKPLLTASTYRLVQGLTMQCNRGRVQSLESAATLVFPRVRVSLRSLVVKAGRLKRNCLNRQGSRGCLEGLGLQQNLT